MSIHRLNPDDPAIRELLGFDEYATKRLVKLRLAKIELESRNRETTANLPAQLEAQLKEETQKFILLRQSVDKDTRETNNLRLEAANHTREAAFYKSKMDELDAASMEHKLSDIRRQMLEVELKRNELAKLREHLEDFRSFEPTNEALRQEIYCLKRSRLSLDMSFVDN